MKLMCGHCTHSLQNQRLWQIPDQDRELYFLGGCGPSRPVCTSSLQPFRALDAGGIETGVYWEEGCYRLVAGASPAERGLGSSAGRAPRHGAGYGFLLCHCKIYVIIALYLYGTPFWHGAGRGRVGILIFKRVYLSFLPWVCSAAVWLGGGMGESVLA